MIAPLAAGIVLGFLGWVYASLKPPPPKVCGSPGGPPVTSPRVKLSDGRHLAYKERGVPKEEARCKIIVSHGFDDSKDFHLPVSQELIEEFQIYILQFDRAGYGESDPNPKRSVKSDALDIRELADLLEIGPKFFVLGISVGSYAAWGCLRYLSQRLSGVALVVPTVNFWWDCLPKELSKSGFRIYLVQDQRTLCVAHHTPWLLYWWMTQKWFPSLSMLEGKLDVFSSKDLEILKQLAGTERVGQEKIRQQGIHESLCRDLMVAYGNWEFNPLDISNPFPHDEGSVHIWQACEDKFIPREVNWYLSRKLPWVKYHEVPEAGHFLIYDPSSCDTIIRELLSS